MAIQAIDQNGFVWLMNVYAGQPSQQPVFLGLSALSGKIESIAKGTFYIGFDNRIQPARVRIFYEPPAPHHIYPGTHTIGLIQFCQYSFQGEPLPPEKYSREIDYKNSYREPVFFSREHFWLDLMDPLNAYQLLRFNGQPLPPFYAYNALLFNRKRPVAEFFTHGQPNGSLLRVGQQPQNNDSLAASLLAPVGLDLDVLDETAITKELMRYQSMGQDSIFSVPYAPNGQDAIQYVLALLNQKKRTLETDQSDQTPDIVEGDIRWVRLVGHYLMIQFDDPEYVGGLICVSQSSDGRTITAHNFDTYTFERLMIDANTHMFEQYKAYQKQKQAFSAFTGTQIDMPLRGRKSLKPSPFLDLGSQEIVVSFTYRTFSYAISEQSSQILGGIQWEVSRKFDLADVQWGVLEFKRPAEIWLPPIDPPYNLKNYLSILNSQTPPFSNPPTSPEIWFTNPQVVAENRPVGFGVRATTWI